MRNLPKEFKTARDFAYFNYDKINKSLSEILKGSINPELLFKYGTTFYSFNN